MFRAVGTQPLSVECDWLSVNHADVGDTSWVPTQMGMAVQVAARSWFAFRRAGGQTGGQAVRQAVRQAGASRLSTPAAHHRVSRRSRSTNTALMSQAGGGGDAGALPRSRLALD